jgi:molybdate-binding protein
VGLAAVHLHGAEPGANTHYLQQSARLTDGILIAFAEREQGLLLAQGNPKGIESLSDLVKLKARLGLRQPGAGAQQLAEQMFGQAGVDFAAVSRSMPVYPTGGELAYAIRSTEVDAGIATRAAAKAQGLDFVPLIWEQFDLALRRRTYFEPGPQKLFALMRSAEFARRAEELTGYRVAEAGMVRFNR